MKIIISGFLDDVYMSFLKSPVACCAPTTNEICRNDGMKPMTLERQQPRLISAPLAQPLEPRGREWVTKSKEFTKRASSRGSFSVKRHLNAYNGFQSKPQRRPQISAPIDFRHVDHAVPRAKKSFRPLELSIYTAENQLSPIMPHFGNIDDLSREKELPAFPPSVMVHSRSESALSHRIPRKPIRSNSQLSLYSTQMLQRPESLEARELLSTCESELPQAPAPARLRSMTAPASYERVKTALQEKRELEQKLKDIEEVIEERKSIYMSSRPTSRATSRARSVVADVPEPLPHLSSTTSFANRVASSPTSDSRPNTASSKPFHIPNRAKSFSEASAAFTTSPPVTAQDHPLPPPPLPLILRAGVRPPLRKKKSFSRVSNWLFPSDQHSRNTSLDSITNAPKAVTSKDGFYQCVVPRNERGSFDTDLTVSTLETDTEGDHPSPPTTWSPQSTPGREQIRQLNEPKIRNLSVDEDSDRSLDMTRVRTFGEKEDGKVQSWELNEEARTRTPYMPVGAGVGVAF